MPKQFVSDLKVNDSVSSTFMVKKKQLRGFSSKPGKYLFLELGDRTGSLEARLWDEAEGIAATFVEGDVVFIMGKVELYNNALQIIINSLRKYDDYSLEDYLCRGKKDQEELFARVEQTIQDIQNPYLQKLLNCFFADPQMVNRFKASPAAKSIHHSYLGGLLEHTGEVIEICRKLCKIYPQIDQDLLLTGALLHDIGKTQELKYGLTVDYTDEGRLIGHLVIGEQMVCGKIGAIEGFPDQLKLRLRHMMLSHHGEYEWGSPKRPKTLEACVLHYADLLDTRINEFLQIIEKDPDKDWSDYNKPLERYIYIGNLDKG